ncbi:MAG TPA: ABC transporter permease [Alphaproteobacteria bacterium]|nr:ABC transporter permease [Alphaproteobacteria bacterium]
MKPIDLLTKVVFVFITFAFAVALAGEHFVPVTTYRTGPYAVTGAPAANGIVDYLKMINARDGGIGGIKIAYEECETAYKPDRFVECYERLKNKGEAGATLFHPFGTGLTYSVIDRVPDDKVPLITMGYGRTDATDGRVFPWVFPLMVNYWSLSTAKIKFIGSLEGGMDKLKGLKIANVYHDSAYGRETGPVLKKQAELYGFELEQFPVAHPGIDQKATWLSIRRSKPDYIILRGWGVMNSTALKEAARIRFPADKIIGVTWSCSEQDTLPAGKAATGYRCSRMTGADASYPLFDDIVKYVHDAGNGTGPIDEMNTHLYKIGVLSSILTVESIRTAMQKYGNKPMSGEEVRWGIENLNIDVARIEALGATGFMSPLKVSCKDHEGQGRVRFARWNGTEFESASDWIETDQSIVRPMVEASAAKYAADNKISMGCN